MHKKTKTKLIYLLNGSIGDFLMVLSMLDSVKKDSYRCYISTPRNHKLFKSLAQEYPDIKIIKYPWKLFRFFFSQTIVITPPTPGRLPYHQKFFARFITIFRGVMAGFDDKQKFNKIIYQVLVPYKTNILFYELLNSVLYALNIPFEDKVPKLRTGITASIHTNPYIVFHPFGASRGRSFIQEKLGNTVSLIRKHFPNHTLYITGSKEDQEKMIEVTDDLMVPYFGKNMDELISLILGSELFIGVDTGVTHIANLLSIKTLVFAEQGTPHWLPYYNPKATIVYSILESGESIHEGQEYLFSQAHGRSRYLDRIPLSVIEHYIQKFSHEI